LGEVLVLDVQVRNFLNETQRAPTLSDISNNNLDWHNRERDAAKRGIGDKLMNLSTCYDVSKFLAWKTPSSKAFDQRFGKFATDGRLRKVS
jgi:hypothetical protein